MHNVPMNSIKGTTIFTTQLLLDQGYSQQAITRAAKAKKLLALRRGIYVENERWNSLYPSEKHLVRMQALATMSNYIFTHESAALALGLPVLDIPKSVHVQALPTSRGKVAGVQKHYYGQAPEVVKVAGLRVTSPVQTLVDCAKTLPLVAALCIADGALHRQLLTQHQAREALLNAQGKGVRACRRVAELMSPLAESPGETLTRFALIQAGFEFVEQFWVYTSAGSFRADFMIKGLKLIIEFDGDVKYRDSTEQAVLAERKRERALQNEGWVVVRLEWKDVQNPAVVEKLVRQGVQRAQPLGTSSSL